MKKPTLVLLLLVAAFALPLAGDGADSDTDIPPPEKSAGVDLRDPKVIEKGMETLNSTCGGYCHGSAGRGYKGPPLRNRPDLTPDGMLATIKFGRKRGGQAHARVGRHVVGGGDVDGDCRHRVPAVRRRRGRPTGSKGAGH